MRRYLTDSAGFTYIELIVGMSLTIMLLGAVFGLLSVSLTSWQVGSSRIDAQQTARIGLDAIVREIRYEAVSIQIPNDTPSASLLFVNRSGQTVEFFRNGNVLSRRLIIGGIPQPSNPIAGSGKGAAILDDPIFIPHDTTGTGMHQGKKFIEITIQVTGTNGSPFTLSTTVIPVNL